MRMNEFDYDSMQKKRIASGDRHRKRGSKSKFCGLPSDHMTEAQWKKRNGEVKIMNLNQPMGWEAFKGMPNDLQKEYVQKCVKLFGCAMSDFAILFDVTSMTVHRGFDSIGIDKSLFCRGKRMSKENRLKFDKWRGADPEQKPVPAKLAPEADFKNPEFSNVLSASSGLEVTFDGAIDYVAVINMLYHFAKDEPVHLTVSVRRDGKHE